MEQANVSTVKNNLCTYLDRVKNGETIVISHRDQPVATLSPYQPTKASKKWSDRLTFLSKNLKVTLPKNPHKKTLRSPVVVKKPVHLVKALLEERGRRI